MLSCQYVDAGYGRVATVSYDVGLLQDRYDWPGLKAIGKIKAVRELKGRTERAVRHFIMSAESSPDRLLELVRSHWAIKNGLHWVQDVVMDKDRMPNRVLNGPECLSALRCIALNIVRLMDDDHSLKGRMHIAGMNDTYLLGLIANAAGKPQNEGSRPHREWSYRPALRRRGIVEVHSRARAFRIAPAWLS